MEVLSAILEKSKSLSSIPAYDDIVDTMGKNLKMNLSLKDAIGLFPFLTSLKSVDSIQLTGYDYEPSGVYYLKLNQQNCRKLKKSCKTI